jgi:hypothetical protein
MKLKWTLAAIALGIAFQAGAGPQVTNPSASSKTLEINLHVLMLNPPAQPRVKIERVGNMSSRPWTQIVGWHPGTSGFPDAETHESKLYLVSVGSGPRR